MRASPDHGCGRWAFDAYKRAGYVTFFGTNMCDWGVMEEVYPFGTKRPPTDHSLMEPWCVPLPFCRGQKTTVPVVR